VIARLPGTDPVRAAENVVLMAHLDHLGVKPDAKAGEDRIYNGALDNAAGVATMLEAAREFVASGRRPARSILFIANTGEEKGLLGADYLAVHPPVPAPSIVSVVDLDMPLPLYDFTDVIAFGADHSTLARTVAQAGKAMGISVSPDPMPQESIFVRSDHYSFVRRGVPAILLMTGYANGGEPVWKHFMANIYHSPADDLSQPIQWRSLARYGMLNTAIARALADDPERPRWYAGDYFGDRVAPGQPRATRLLP
jgi:Zn-dependent M28 family amino/carboxypeptidase